MEFICATCNKEFQTNQQLQRHNQRRFKCKPFNGTQEQVSAFECSCGKKYKYATGLYRHRALCVHHLKPTTKQALNNIHTINNYDNLDTSKINWEQLQKKCAECETESDIFKVRCCGITVRWASFRMMYQYIIEQMFFNNPYNMMFYISNLTSQTALMFNGVSVDEISENELIDKVLDCADSVIDKMIESFKLDEYHPFVFIINYKNNSTPREVSTIAYNFLQQNIKSFILQQFKDRKDDIRAVWRKAGLL
jgi:hypothetical protein